MKMNKKAMPADRQGFTHTPKFGVTLQSKGGFTLIEMTMLMGIMIIISSITLAGYPRFNQRTSLSRTAQEIVLAIREAQVYGYGSIERAGVYPDYGVHFDLTNPSSFIMFVDSNQDDIYTLGEEIEIFNINTNNTITDLCGDKKTFAPGTCRLTDLDIIFKRPDILVTLKGATIDYSDMEIIVTSPGGDQRQIVLWKIGQITTEPI